MRLFGASWNENALYMMKFVGDLAHFGLTFMCRDITIFWYARNVVIFQKGFCMPEDMDMDERLGEFT